MTNSISPSGRLAPSGAGRRAVGRRKLVLWGALLAVLATPLSMMALTDETASAVVQKGRDFLALMKDRSPGQRTAAELTKLKKSKAAAVKPRQRALAKVQKPAAPKEFLEALAPALPQLAELPPTLVTFGLFPPVALVPPAPGGFILPPGGPGGPIFFPPGSNNPPAVVPPPEVPAVPEPSTWLTMLLGFGLLGAACRAQRRQRRAIARA